MPVLNLARTSDTPGADLPRRRIDVECRYGSDRSGWLGCSLPYCLQSLSRSAYPRQGGGTGEHAHSRLTCRAPSEALSREGVSLCVGRIRSPTIASMRARSRCDVRARRRRPAKVESRLCRAAGGEKVARKDGEEEIASHTAVAEKNGGYVSSITMCNIIRRLSWRPPLTLFLQAPWAIDRRQCAGCILRNIRKWPPAVGRAIPDCPPGLSVLPDTSRPRGSRRKIHIDDADRQRMAVVRRAGRTSSDDSAQTRRAYIFYAPSASAASNARSRARRRGRCMLMLNYLHRARPPT